jgi:hypothetical protein
MEQFALERLAGGAILVRGVRWLSGSAPGVNQQIAHDHALLP